MFILGAGKRRNDGLVYVLVLAVKWLWFLLDA